MTIETAIQVKNALFARPRSSTRPVIGTNLFWLAHDPRIPGAFSDPTGFQRCESLNLGKMLFPFDSSSMAPLLAFVLTLGCSSIDASELGCVPAEADDGELQRGPVVVATTDGTPVVEYENSYALLVGVTRYQEGWGAIESIPQELSLVRDVLEEHRFEVELTLDPNEAEMRSTIEVFIDTHGFNERNRLLIYFAGHGQRLEFEDGVRGYLVPADAPWPSREKVRFLRSAIDFNEIIALMRKITARHVLFVFGSCYSGVIERRHGDRWHCDHGDRWARGPSRAFDAG